MSGQIPVMPVGLPGLAALMLGLFGFLLAVLAARRRASTAGEAPVAHKSRASWMWIAVQGMGVGIATFGPLRVTLDPLSSLALLEMTFIGVLMAGAVALFVAASRAMGKNWSLVARTRTDHQLVQTGPFARVRHPIYVAIFLVMLAIAVAYGHLANLIVALPVFALGTWYRVAHEERLLKVQFGTAYAEYAARVTRFVPGLF